ncbi:MAG: sarcosine oxidase subunit gamma family protein [Lysobacterales bacterium]|jgi:heterotetrameric sarcosine oxidase gamma subunit
MTVIEPHPRPTPLQQAGMTVEALATPALSILEVADVALLRLHSLAVPVALDAALGKAGISLTPDTGSVTGEEPAVLCLRPGEWLMICETTDPDVWVERLTPLLDPDLSALLNLSDGLGMFRLSGPAAPWLLAKFSGLDFLADPSKGRQATRTRFADIGVVVHAHPGKGGERQFDLVFDRSVAPYLWGLLKDAAPHARELTERHGSAA